MAARPKLLIADEAMPACRIAEGRRDPDLLMKLTTAASPSSYRAHHVRGDEILAAHLRAGRGRKIADGDPQAVVKNPEVEKAYLGE